MARVALHSPATAAAEHATLVVALDAGDLAGADRDRALALAAACAGCASLLGDLAAIRAATAALPAPARRRDYRLTDADAARLRPSPWRRLVHWLGAPQSTVRPFAGALATLGIAGLLLGATPGSSARRPRRPPRPRRRSWPRTWPARRAARPTEARASASRPAPRAGPQPPPGSRPQQRRRRELPAPPPDWRRCPRPALPGSRSLRRAAPPRLRSPARAPWRSPRRARPQSRFPRPRPPPPASEPVPLVARPPGPWASRPTPAPRRWLRRQRPPSRCRRDTARRSQPHPSRPALPTRSC